MLTTCIPLELICNLAQHGFVQARVDTDWVPTRISSHALYKMTIQECNLLTHLHSPSLKILQVYDLLGLINKPKPFTNPAIMSDSTTAYGDLSHLNFTGGFPTSKDLAPSIIFLVIVSLPELSRVSLADLGSTSSSRRYSFGG